MPISGLGQGNKWDAENETAERPIRNILSGFGESGT